MVSESTNQTADGVLTRSGLVTSTGQFRHTTIMIPSRKRSIYRIAVVTAMTVIAVLVAGYRAQRGAVEQIRAFAQRQGFELEYSAVTRYPFATVVRHVKLRPKQPSFVEQAGIDAITIRTSFTGKKAIAVDGCHLALSGDPASVFDAILEQSKSQLADVAWGRVDLEYTQRVFGKLALIDVQLERRDQTLLARVREAKLGAGRWQDVLFSIQRRNQMIEVGLADESPNKALIQLGFFPSTRGLTQWTLSLKHQPARPLAEALGWNLGEEFEATRVAGSLSFVVPTDRERPFRGLLQLVIDRWQHPDWTESEALLGNTASFLARIIPSEDLSHWDLVYVDVSLAVFSLLGSGRVTFAERPSLAFDVRGTRSCAQIQGNTAPSSHLDRVNAYLGEGAADAANRRTENAAMRLQVLAERATGKRHVAWQLEPGCGLSELRESNFLELQLPPREETSKR